AFLTAEWRPTRSGSSKLRSGPCLKAVKHPIPLAEREYGQLAKCMKRNGLRRRNGKGNLLRLGARCQSRQKPADHSAGCNAAAIAAEGSIKIRREHMHVWQRI